MKNSLIYSAIIYTLSSKKISTDTKKYKNAPKNPILYKILSKYVYFLLDILV